MFSGRRGLAMRQWLVWFPWYVSMFLPMLGTEAERAPFELSKPDGISRSMFLQFGTRMSTTSFDDDKAATDTKRSHAKAVVQPVVPVELAVARSQDGQGANLTQAAAKPIMPVEVTVVKAQEKRPYLTPPDTKAAAQPVMPLELPVANSQDEERANSSTGTEASVVQKRTQSRHRRQESVAQQMLYLFPFSVTAIVLVALTVFVLFTGKPPPPQDLVVVGATSSLVALVGIGVWGDVAGGGLPVLTWFGWHAVLMTASVMCFMFCGRYSFVMGAEHTPLDVPRFLQWGTLTFAVCMMIVGYFANFEGHSPRGPFIAYNFQKYAWSTDYSRILHVYFGYLAIIAAASQVVMAFWKHDTSRPNERAMNCYVLAEKAIIVNGGLAVLTACWFWEWSVLLKSCVVVLTVVALVFGTVLPTPPQPVLRSSPGAPSVSKDI